MTHRVRAVAANDGRILAVGWAAGIAETAGPQTRVNNAGSRALFQGFVKGHHHRLLDGAGIRQMHINGRRGSDALVAG